MTRGSTPQQRIPVALLKNLNVSQIKRCLAGHNAVKRLKRRLARQNMALRSDKTITHPAKNIPLTCPNNPHNNPVLQTAIIHAF